MQDFGMNFGIQFASTGIFNKISIFNLVRSILIVIFIFDKISIFGPTF